MMTRKRTLMGLALAGVLATATASLAQRGDADRPAAPAREFGPFVRIGNHIINVARVDYIEIRKSEGAGAWLTIYLTGRSTPAPVVRAADAVELLRTLGLPPIEPAATRP